MDNLKVPIDKIYEAYSEAKSYRGAARKLGIDHKTVMHHIKRHENAIYEASQSSQKISSINERYSGNKKVHVITSAQNATEIDSGFFGALVTYCKERKAQLHVLKVPYRNPTSPFESELLEDSNWYHPTLIPYIVDNNLILNDNLVIMGGIKIQATSANPLSSTHFLARGRSAILASTQLCMQSLNRVHSDHPVAIYTTGAVTVPNFGESKSGYIADFNHQLSAIVVEMEDDGSFHMRDVCYDGEGFYDFDRYITKNGVIKVKNSAAAFQPGDLHARFMDDEVFNAYFGDDGLCSVIKPEKVYLHDALDAYATSHHHEKMPFTKFAKFHSGLDCLETELELTYDTIRRIHDGSKGSEIVIVDSNHNRHLRQAIENMKPNSDPRNAVIYHLLMYLMLNKTRMSKSGASYPDPFKLYADHIGAFKDRSVRFIYGNVSEKLLGIEMSQHGDIGAGGSRGSPKQFAKFSMKMNTGHTHVDGIQNGCRTAGTMSLLQLEYNHGPSAWTHGAIITYKNGQRQNVRIIKGRYRSSWL